MGNFEYLEKLDSAKQKILKYVLYKKRTEREIRQKFASTIEEDLLEDAIEDLKENGYINDESYIQRAVNEFMALKNLSMKEIRYKLLSKGLSNDIIDTYFSNHRDELEAFEKQSITNIYYKKSSQLEIEEIIQFLTKKGYNIDYIKEVLREVE